MIIRKIPIYNLKSASFAPIKSTDFLDGRFYLALPELPSEFDKEKLLFNAGNALILRVIKRSYNDDTEDINSLRREHCFYFGEEDEWILEAECNMQTPDGADKGKFFLRLPLSAPFAKGKIGIYFDGTWIRFIKDGRVLNENAGMARFDVQNGDIFEDEVLKGIEASGADEVFAEYREEETQGTAAFYTPFGYNTNVGDVMTFFRNGVYHVIYLHDRRHHGSRNGFGAHYLCHMTTENLVDWYEQVPIADIGEPWMSYGTGTMLFYNGKYYMTYGLHTERYNGSEKITEPVFSEETGEFEIADMEEILKRGELPAGASYSVSDDGINFKASKKLFHASRNPSAYTSDKGGITCYCGYGGDGVFESESFTKPFRRAENNIDFVNNSIMGNTSECPAMFSWNGYKYVLVGFTGYFRTLEENDDTLSDAAALGEYIYDGLSVPMVSEFHDNRRIMAGWVKSPYGWGGVLMQRELVFERGGSLGTKWISELMPEPTGEIRRDNFTKIAIERKKSCYMELCVKPNGTKKFGLCLSDGNKACTFELDFENKRAQINDASRGEFAEPLETVIEQMKKADKKCHYGEATDGNIPQNAKNYAISNIKGTDEDFSLKLILRYSKKMRSTVLDFEIAECRTMISVRDGFFPTEISILSEKSAAAENKAFYTIEDVE